MKKLVVLSLIAFAAACSSGDSSKTAETGDASPWLNANCSEDCNGNLAGVTDGSCAEYNSNLYESGVITCTDECLADTTNCVEREAPKAQEFSVCTGGPGQGNCDDGLECASFDGTTSYCVRPCQGEDDTTTCGDNSCIEFTSASFCLQATAQRDTACLENLKWCAEGQGECQPTSYDYDAQTGTDFRCKITCDSAVENTCVNGESCLPDPLGFGSVQETNPDCVDDSTCDPGYECVELNSGNQQCFKRNALCGNPIGNCMFDISEIDADTPMGEIQNLLQDTAGECYDTYGECTVQDAVGHAYCDEITPADPEASGAFSMCVDMGRGVCIAFCDGNSGDLDCGEGFACERPAQAFLYLDVARDASDEYVTCASAEDTSCGEIAFDEGDHPYTCIELTIGFTCARALKQCVQIATVEEPDTEDAGTDDAGTDGTGTDG